MPFTISTSLNPRDPAAQAAMVLRRIGFLILFGLTPTLSAYSRRAVLVLPPVAAMLLLLAALIEAGDHAARLQVFGRLFSLGGAAGLFFLIWAGLSLIWTPFPDQSMTRYGNLFLLSLGALVIISAMPARVSASRLYILAGGVALGTAIILTNKVGSFFSTDAEGYDQDGLRRSLLLLVLLLPASVAWLFARNRVILGLVLAVAVVIAAGVLMAGGVMLALLLGGAVFYFSIKPSFQIRRVIGFGLAGLLIAAPLIPLLLHGVTHLIVGEGNPLADGLDAWNRVVIDDPLRLLTGHGYDTAWRAVSAGLVPSASPNGLLFDLWFELGFLGVLALAIAIQQTVSLTQVMSRAGSAAAVSTITLLFALMTFAQGASQVWWPMTLVLPLFALVALERAQFRTSRPKSAPIHEANTRRSRLSAALRL